LNSGWYAILQARFYAVLPGRAGTAMAVGNLAGVLGSLVPAGLGLVAEAAGLPAAMWLLLAGPIALLIGLPRGKLRRSSASPSPRA
jgi:FSR family fosmidomycin resistance protein-like MFS transporter